MNNNITMNFNHPVQELILPWILQNMTYEEFLKIRKNAEDNRKINTLCDSFNKLCIPKTYQEFIDNLSQDDKDKLKDIDNNEKKCLINFFNNNYE